MAAWVLVCNPKRFRLREMLDDGGELTSWSVGRHLKEIHEGDIFALWLSGPGGGVAAIGRLTGEPFWTDEDDDEGYWAEAPGPRHVAPLRVEQWLETLVPRAWFEGQSAFAGAGVLTQPFATNPHRLTDQQWGALVAEVERTVTDAPEVQLPQNGGWGLEPGDEIRRVDLHTRYGGSRQGGISPSKASNNVIVFTDPRTGEQHGYQDVWESEDHFRYTGEGQVGNQVFTRGNKAIRDHLREGRHLRLFIGSRGIVRYAGEWILDPNHPYSWGRAPSTGGGEERQVIHFHMLRVGAVVTASDVPVGTVYRVEDEGATLAPAAPSAPDPALMGETLSKHRQLQNGLAQQVRDRGLQPLSPLPTDPAFDLAWRDDGTLTVAEVKSLRLENESHQLRAGLGQLLDYVDQLSARAQQVRGVLWVERAPSEDRWLGICERAGVILAWPGADTRVWQ